jgi:6-phosphogluconolactonase
VETFCSRKASARFAILVAPLFLNLMSSNPNLAAADTTARADHYIVYIGTYGKGVHAFRFSSSNGDLQPLGLVGEVNNPSWVGVDPDFKNLYAASEVSGKTDGGVASFAIDRKTGKLTSLNHVSSAGEAPCHLSVDATGRMLVVANYGTGAVASFPIEGNGGLGPMASLMTAHGSSANKERQEGPHAHAAVITSDNKRVYVPDLGLDQIRIYQIDPASGKLTPNDPPAVHGAPGLGPRHIVFDKSSKYAYVLNEIKPVVSVYERDPANGNLKLIQSVATLPADFKEDNTGAEIRLSPSGKFLYTSNRGQDTIQVFAVDPAAGTLEKVQNVPTGGKEPRGFALDPTGRFLLVGNQNSNTLFEFKIDPQNGHLTPSGKHFDVTSPVDVLFVPAV